MLPAAEGALLYEDCIREGLGCLRWAGRLLVLGWCLGSSLWEAESPEGRLNQPKAGIKG